MTRCPSSYIQAHPHYKMTDSTRVPKRGPLPTSNSRQDTFKASTKKRRDDLLKSGKVEFKTFIDAETKEVLAAIKATHKLDTLGAAVDYLAKQQKSQN